MLDERGAALLAASRRHANKQRFEQAAEALRDALGHLTYYSKQVLGEHLVGHDRYQAGYLPRLAGYSDTEQYTDPQVMFSLDRLIASTNLGIDIAEEALKYTDKELRLYIHDMQKVRKLAQEASRALGVRRVRGAEDGVGVRKVRGGHDAKS